VRPTDADSAQARALIQSALLADERGLIPVTRLLPAIAQALADARAEGVAQERARCLRLVHEETELPGPIPDDVFRALSASGPEASARAVCRAMKRSLAAALMGAP
jgi:hypothetical protein